MSTELVWGLPPKARGENRGSAAEFVEQLKARPGEWALYPTSHSASIAHQYKRAYPGTEWTTRTRPEGKFDVYARWVGES